ncbi:MAG: response regulator [Verrucomicrobia bacterium]|nr:response regulator [Verrucomicrobiota bacterium]
MNPACRLHLVCLALGLLGAIVAQAVDPLPPDVEKAPLEFRAQYWDRMGRDALRQKLIVGQQRYDKKIAVQNSVAQHIQAASASRLAGIQAELTGQPQTQPAATAHAGNGFGHYLMIVLGIVGFGLALRKWGPEFLESLQESLGTSAASASAAVRMLSGVPATAGATTAALQAAVATAGDGLVSSSLGGEVAPSDTEADEQGELPARTAPRTTAAPANGLTPEERALRERIENEQSAADSTASPSSASLPSRSAAAPPAAELPTSFAPTQEKVAALRMSMQELTRDQDEEARQETLTNLYLHVHSVASKAGLADMRPVLQLGSALAALIKTLLEKPKNATPSTLRTVANALDLLNDLCGAQLTPYLGTDPPIRTLVVDDELMSRRAMSFALQKVFDRPDVAEHAEAALEWITTKPYDVIFLDVRMPGMNGFELCTKIRGTEINKATPVVFVTAHADFAARAQSSLCGGNDLLAKPFLFIEITVKALTFALRARLQQLKSRRQAASLARSAGACRTP